MKLVQASDREDGRDERPFRFSVPILDREASAASPASLLDRIRHSGRKSEQTETVVPVSIDGKVEDVAAYRRVPKDSTR